MWIALAILATLATMVTAVLLMPVKVIIKNDENNPLILRYKFFFKTFGDNPKPDDPIVKTLKKAGGVERLEKNFAKENVQDSGLQNTISESYSTIVDLLKELVYLLKNCTVTKLNIEICSAGDDAAQVAVNYGIYNSITHALLGALQAFLKIRKRGCKINIYCDFNRYSPSFRYHLIIAVPLFRVLIAFWRIVVAEAKRTNQSK